MPGIPENEYTQRLVKAMMAAGTEEELLAFLTDLCTVPELEAMSQRLEIAKGLNAGETYESLRRRLGASNTTITRVSSALSYGAGGYKSVLEKLKE